MNDLLKAVLTILGIVIFIIIFVNVVIPVLKILVDAFYFILIVLIGIWGLGLI